MKALLFSGQGSQYIGMLKDVCEKYPNAMEMIKKADEILGYSISDIMFNGPIEKLKETRYTQPSVFLHSVICFDLIKDKLNYQAVAGHSVGEYSALYAAGVINFEDALKLVAFRGDLMFTAGEKIPGTMFAVINLENEKVIEVCNDLTNGDKVVVAANFNSPGQVVVSGSRDYLRENITAFKDAGARIVKELVVSGAFHSSLMNPAKLELEKQINKLDFSKANCNVYTNVTALSVTDPLEIKNLLIQQLTSPVLWSQSLENMQKNYINDFVEIGPSKVLQGLVKRTLKDVNISGIDKVEDLNNLLKFVNK